MINGLWWPGQSNVCLFGWSTIWWQLIAERYSVHSTQSTVHSPVHPHRGVHVITCPVTLCDSKCTMLYIPNAKCRTPKSKEPIYADIKYTLVQEIYRPFTSSSISPLFPTTFSASPLRLALCMISNMLTCACSV